MDPIGKARVFKFTLESKCIGGLLWIAGKRRTSFALCWIRAKRGGKDWLSSVPYFMEYGAHKGLDALRLLPTDGTSILSQR